MKENTSLRLEQARNGGCSGKGYLGRDVAELEHWLSIEALVEFSAIRDGNKINSLHYYLLLRNSDYSFVTLVTVLYISRILFSFVFFIVIIFLVE